MQTEEHMVEAPEYNMHVSDSCWAADQQHRQSSLGLTTSVSVLSQQQPHYTVDPAIQSGSVSPGTL